MTLRLNDTAPDFTAETTQGKINFTSGSATNGRSCSPIPRTSRPVCTTELGYMAKIEPEFTKRNTKLIGLSIDPSEAHARWLADIEETQGAKVNYPIIADNDLAVSKLYNMLPAEEPGTSEGRTAATNQAVRTVFVIGPDKKIKLLLDLSDDHRPQLRRDPARARFHAAHGQAQGGDAGELEARRRRDHLRLGQRRRRQEIIPEGWRSPKPYIRIVKQPA